MRRSATEYAWATPGGATRYAWTTSAIHSFLWTTRPRSFRRLPGDVGQHRAHLQALIHGLDLHLPVDRVDLAQLAQEGRFEVAQAGVVGAECMASAAQGMVVGFLR